MEQTEANPTIIKQRNKNQKYNLQHLSINSNSIKMRISTKPIKKALIDLKLYNCDFKDDVFSFYGYYMEKSYSPELYASKIEKSIDNLDINDLIKFKKYELYKKIINYIVHNEYYNKDILPNEAEDIIEDILFEAIDDE